MMSTTDDMTIPPEIEGRMPEGSWTDELRRAWKVMETVRPGDTVVWADRSVGMEVEESGTNEDGERVLKVEKPRADGHYEVRETWENGRYRVMSDIGRANNIHFVERADGVRGLSHGQFETLAERQTENALDSFRRHDYEDWARAVSDVVETWAEDVVHRRWRGYAYHPDWQDGDAEAIFTSVVDHADADVDDSLSLREQAEVALHQEITRRGQTRAEESIVTSEQEYRDLVERLAHHVIDRIERKSYVDARVATRDTISDWIDDRQPAAYATIIEYGENRFEDDLYADESVEQPDREMAFDILDHDVWEEVQLLQRDRGEHDPTLRGMTSEQYWETVDVLAGKTLRRWQNDGFLRTTAKDVVEEWADRVDAEVWNGHRHRVWAAGDVEDIFASASIHSDANPFLWNPFASDKERRMAEQAMVADVVDQAEETYEETEPKTEPRPADEYIDEVLGLDMTYDDMKDAQPEDVDEVLGRIVDAMEGDEVGWTFVDEIIESGGVVPEATNDWVLVDYGVIRQGDTLRKLAWFDRSTGDVLVLSGQATAAPRELGATEEPYDTFHVTYHEYNTSEPEFICEDISLGDALDCVYDYIDGTKADIRIIETRDEDWVQEQITHEDINAGGVLDALIPNLPWGKADLFTLADSKGRGVARFTVRDWAPELASLTAYAALSIGPRWIGERLDGVRVEPNIHKHHGVGTRISKEFGDAPHESGIGGKASIDINVRPQTFSNLANDYAPKFVKRGVDEGDIGKGAMRVAGESLDDLQDNAWGQEFLDEFGQSALSFMEVLKTGGEDAITDERRREFLADFYDKPVDEVDIEEEWEQLAPEVRQGFFEDVLSETEFSWDEFEQTDLGISGMLMRGLDAESLVSGAEFFEIDDWLDGHFTMYANDYIDPDDPPSFEEWKQDRYGPGKPAGPEQEAQMMARYHKEVAAAAPEDVDPYEALGIDEQMAEEGSDYDQYVYDFDDGFGTTFDDVAERQAENTDEMAAEAFERQDEMDEQ